MGHTDDHGNQTTIPYNAPYKEQTQSKLSLIANLTQNYQAFAVPFQAKYSTASKYTGRYHPGPKDAFRSQPAPQEHFPGLPGG